MILDLTRFSPPSTGFFFLLSWSLFTSHHREEISQDFSSLGSSYWLGAFGWVLLLVVEPIVFVVEQAVVPDILPDLEKSVESWRIASQVKAAKLTFSDSYYPGDCRSILAPEGLAWSSDLRTWQRKWMWMFKLRINAHRLNEKPAIPRSFIDLYSQTEYWLTVLGVKCMPEELSLNPECQWDWRLQLPEELIVVVSLQFALSMNWTEIKTH